ncbi:MAG: aminodeoxychorismate synthase component I, partial [Pseudomonadota bacterium]|nr:aminodeoxychorismate synthase component I [Pseudomonadota bacterium]
PPYAIEEDDPEQFTTGVTRILDYLSAGDVFQVNLSRGWRARFDTDIDPAALHARLREANPAPFAGLLAGDGWAVVSASPERLVSVRGDVVETRPIAGTRPRFTGDDDAARIRELVGHPKERAEHVMLIDLERNDLGRVCVAGSVEVDELMTVESYAHVHHIVSNVRGRLRDDATPGAVIRAVFPGGTITGCPKVRCMQIIAEIEGIGRGTYTGAMGWLNRDGDLDLNILIRSAEIEGSKLRFRAGAGIVADSDPQRELDETRAKARGMLKALGVEA